MVTVEAPAVVVNGLGEIPVICGAGLLMVKVAAVEVPPPGTGFTTTICTISPNARSAGVSVTCSCVELTNVGVRLP